MPAAKSAAQPKRRPGPMDLIALGRQLAMMEVHDLYRQVMEQNGGKDGAKGEQPKGGDPKSGDVEEAKEMLAAKGRGGDTEIAHVNKREQKALKEMGGSGEVNPKTGLKEFTDSGQGDGGGDSSGSSGDSGSSDSGGTDGMSGTGDAGEDSSGRGSEGMAGADDSDTGTGFNGADGESTSGMDGISDYSDDSSRTGPAPGPAGFRGYQDVSPSLLDALMGFTGTPGTRGPGSPSIGSRGSPSIGFDPAVGPDFRTEPSYGPQSSVTTSPLGLARGISKKGEVGPDEALSGFLSLIGMATPLGPAMALGKAMGGEADYGGISSQGNSDIGDAALLRSRRTAPSAETADLTEALRSLEGRPSAPRAPNRLVGGVDVAPGFGGRSTVNPAALRAVLMSMGRPYPNQRSL